jgi:hypothetical protein
MRVEEGNRYSITYLPSLMFDGASFCVCFFSPWVFASSFAVDGGDTLSDLSEKRIGVSWRVWRGGSVLYL